MEWMSKDKKRRVGSYNIPHYSLFFFFGIYVYLSIYQYISSYGRVSAKQLSKTLATALSAHPSSAHAGFCLTDNIARRLTHA